MFWSCFCDMAHRWVPTRCPSCWWNHLGVPAGLGVRSRASSPCIRPALPFYSPLTASSSPLAMPAPWRWTGERATSGPSSWAKERESQMEVSGTGMTWYRHQQKNRGWLSCLMVQDWRGRTDSEEWKGLARDHGAVRIWSNGAAVADSQWPKMVWKTYYAVCLLSSDTGY